MASAKSSSGISSKLQRQKKQDLPENKKTVMADLMGYATRPAEELRMDQIKIEVLGMRFSISIYNSAQLRGRLIIVRLDKGTEFGVAAFTVPENTLPKGVL